MKSLVIVESPAKAKTINKFLGDDYEVLATVGHVKDLPKQRLGIDIANHFRPEYITILGKKKVLDQLKSKAHEAASILLAPDPDREGEAICWHLVNELSPINSNIRRIMFHEITKAAVTKALDQPRELDRQLVDAQQARRVLDRLVGYKVSPLLWHKVKKGLSAGRVQSVALRLIVDREREIEAFRTEEYWTLFGQFKGTVPEAFKARLAKVNGKKPQITNGDQAAELAALIRQGVFRVSQIEEKQQTRQPAPPFITSTLQQEAARRLRYDAQRTMRIAQALYEGKDLGKQGATGLITYMRTDSPRLSQESLEAVRAFIENHFGVDFLPEKPNTYPSRKSAQEAHEAIRPTDVELTPESVASYLSKEELALYEVIWKRFIACQMKPQILLATTITIEDHGLEFQVRGLRSIFNGFSQVYAEMKDESAEAEAEEVPGNVPILQKDESLTLVDVVSEQKFTKPPNRFTEASLVKALEESGIGRPSTYATILQIIRNRNYGIMEQRKYQPTELGKLVVDLLVRGFPRLMNIEFTALLEQELDEIEEGHKAWEEIVGNFYADFSNDLAHAEQDLPSVKSLTEATSIVCDKCGSPMVLKWGEKGRFLACSGYPKCRNTMEYKKNEAGAVEAVMLLPYPNRFCPKCNSPLYEKKGRFGRFLACRNYPQCKHSQPFPLEIHCPEPGCSGDVIELHGKRGKAFYGCSSYPQCQFRLWRLPINRSCPKCGYGLLVSSRNRKGEQIVSCPKKECGFTQTEEPDGATS